MLAIQRNQNENGRGEITFVDFDCTELNSLQDAGLPQTPFPPLEARGFLTINSSSQLYFIDARSQAIETVAENVSIARTAGDSLWTLEDGALIVRNNNFQEIARMGSGVLEFSVVGGAKITAAYRDAQGISIWTQADGSTVISESGCAVQGWGGDSVAFIEPCAGGALTVYTTGSRIGSDSDFVKLVGPTGVIYPERAIASWGQLNRPTEIVLTTSDPDQIGDTLMVARVPEEPTEGESTYQLDLEMLSNDSVALRGGQIFTGWNGVTGTLVELERDEDNLTVGLNQVARRVAQVLGDGPYSPFGMLVDFEDGLGTVKAFSKNGSDITSVIVAENVPIQTHFEHEENDRRLFIADSRDSSVGTLYLTDVPSGNSPPDAQAIGENVYLDTARFLEQPRGVAYLARRANSDYAAMRVWLMDADLTLTVHETVSEYRIVPWPASGILYAVPDGGDRGLWFSKAR
jgi:hypothetical protein